LTNQNAVLPYTKSLAELSEDLIDNLGICECGAVTISFTDGTSASMPTSEFESKLGCELTIDMINSDMFSGRWFQCNHCVNGWGIDLCKCGSGEKAEECCGNPSQWIGPKGALGNGNERNFR